MVLIENGQAKYLVNELGGTWAKSIGESHEQYAYTPLLQSQLTGGNVDELLASNYCGLTPFGQSCELHIPLITVLLTHISAVLNEKLDACPIT